MTSRIDIVKFGELSDDDVATWSALRAANPALVSPFFDPRFAATVDHVWSDVMVAIVRSVDGTPSWILPVQEQRGVARPAGWPATDFQGSISAPDHDADPRDVLRAGAWRAFRFDHLLDGLPGFDDAVDLRHQSPRIDIRGGLDGYLARASSTGRQNIQQARRRLNKAGRELGPVRFVADTTDRGVLDDVVRLKRGQYRATGALDYFAVDGRREFLDAILAERERDFAGVLSALFAGDQLLAAHFGIRSGGVLHWWFPVYEPEFARLGPGWMLLHHLIQSGPEQGFDLIDLGRGDDEYKRRAKTDDVVVCEGSLEARALVRRARTLRRRAVASVRASPVGPPAVRAAKRVRTRLGR